MSRNILERVIQRWLYKAVWFYLILDSFVFCENGKRLKQKKNNIQSYIFAMCPKTVFSIVLQNSAASFSYANRIR